MELKIMAFYPDSSPVMFGNATITSSSLDANQTVYNENGEVVDRISVVTTMITLDNNGMELFVDTPNHYSAGVTHRDVSSFIFLSDANFTEFCNSEGYVLPVLRGVV